MLQITVPAREFYDERTEQFVYTKEYKLNLEHSLLSISKWEAKYCKPFLSKDENDTRTALEMLDYIRCMTLNKNVPDEVYASLTPENILDINKYIQHPSTATTIYEKKKQGGKKEIITSELIYYWMVAYQIPFECEKWHINRLLMLVKVCEVKNNPQKPGKPDMVARHKLNEARLAAARAKRGKTS